MNKEAELPKSIDFSQLPQALRAFKAGEGRAHTHTHTEAWTHVRAHTYRETQTDRKEKGLRVKG